MCLCTKMEKNRACWLCLNCYLHFRFIGKRIGEWGACNSNCWVKFHSSIKYSYKWQLSVWSVFHCLYEGFHYIAMKTCHYYIEQCSLVLLQIIHLIVFRCTNHYDVLDVETDAENDAIKESLNMLGVCQQLLYWFWIILVKIFWFKDRTFRKKI